LYPSEPLDRQPPRGRDDPVLLDSASRLAQYPMHTTLIVPGLFPEIPDAEIPRLPNLERCLSLGQLTIIPGQWMLEHCLALPAGPAEACRLRADPIHLHVEGDALLLLDRHSLEISPEEADALIESLNRHFASEGMVFAALTGDQWQVLVPEPHGISTTHPLKRVGRNIDGFLPVGENARRWQARFNEIQMLLHDHPVNKDRESRGKRAISGVWFWDEHEATGFPWGKNWPAEAEVVETLRAPSAYGDAEGWRESARRFDEERLAPLLKSLGRGEVKKITLLALEGRCSALADITRWNLLRVWRRPRPLPRIPGIPSLDHD
jgi:hypothetical protein